MTNELVELLQEVRRIEAQSTQLVTSVMAGGYSSVFRGAGIEFDNIREYSEGDDPRSVDWNVTARIGRPFIKEYVEERELTMTFLVDCSATMQAGLGAWSPRQMAARVCACLGLSALRNDDSVGLVAFGADIERVVPPRKGTRHVLRIIRECLATSATGIADLGKALDYVGRLLRRRSVVFVVSDFLTPSNRWGPALRLCAKRHDLIAVHVRALDLWSMPPATLGLVRTSNPVTGKSQVLDWRSQKFRRTYQERMRRWHETLVRDLRQARVDRIDAAVPATPDRQAVAEPILAFFRMREQRSHHR